MTSDLPFQDLFLLNAKATECIALQALLKGQILLDSDLCTEFASIEDFDAVHHESECNKI